MADVETEGSVFDSIDTFFANERKNALKIHRAHYGTDPGRYVHQEFPKMVYHVDYTATKDPELRHSLVKEVDSPEELSQLGPEWHETLQKAQDAASAKKDVETKKK